MDLPKYNQHDRSSTPASSPPVSNAPFPNPNSSRVPDAHHQHQQHRQHQHDFPCRIFNLNVYNIHRNEQRSEGREPVRTTSGGTTRALEGAGSEPVAQERQESEASSDASVVSPTSGEDENAPEEKLDEVPIAPRQPGPVSHRIQVLVAITNVPVRARGFFTAKILPYCTQATSLAVTIFSLILLEILLVLAIQGIMLTMIRR